MGEDMAAAAARAAQAAGLKQSVWLRQAIAEKLEQECQPKRSPVTVAPDLTALQGPSAGVVKLPLHLFWSRENAVFDLGDRDERLEMYEAVLAQARTQEDLVKYLNVGLLVCLWPDVYGKEVRHAWEARHPVLRAIGELEAA